MGLGPPDQDLKTWGSREDVPPAVVPLGVELGSRQRHQIRLPEHGEESKGEAHLQCRTEGLQTESDGAEVMAQGGGGRGRMGRCHRGCVHMEMLAARSKQDIWKDSRATGVRPISLWRILTPET